MNLFDNFSRFLDTRSIFYPPYLGSAAMIAFLWLVVGRQVPLGLALQKLGAREVWLTASTRADLLFTLFQFFLLRVPVAAVEGWVFLMAWHQTGKGLLAVSGTGGGFFAPVALEGALATVVTMLAIDFASYSIHRCMHRVPWLWGVHMVHHSAEVLTPLTTYRQHPLEPFLLNAARGAAAGIGLAMLHRIFPHQTPVVSVWGMGVGFFLYMFTVNLHHAPVSVHYPRWARLLLISPHIHHLHHSADARHYGHNFGVIFSIWDRAFGTYLDKAWTGKALQYGLGVEDPFRHSLVACLLPAAARSVVRTFLEITSRRHRRTSGQAQSLPL